MSVDLQDDFTASLLLVSDAPAAPAPRVVHDPLNAVVVLSAAGRTPAVRSRPAIWFAQGAGHGSISHASLHAMVNRAARALTDLNVGLGDRVLLLLEDSPWTPVLVLATIQVGGIVVPLNTRLRQDDYGFIAQDSQAKLIITESALAASLPAVKQAVALLDAGNGEFAEALAARILAQPPHANLQAAPALTDASDPCVWLYSSGTTGRPKAAVHTHRSIAQSSKLLREVASIAPHDRVYCTSRLFFTFAFDNAMLGVLAAGACTAISREWPEPEVTVARVAHFRPTMFLTVPTYFRRLLALDGAKLDVFRETPWYFTGGERVPDAVALAWRERAGHDILPCYGMSETFCNAFANRQGALRLGSCGQALAGVEARLLDADRQPVASGEPGVLWLKHPTQAARYHNPEHSAKAFDDGWFCTNDQFRVDADGYWFHEGRADELLKVAGQWVKPGEVEEAALGEGVRESASCVVPDQDGFDRLALFIVADGDAAAMVARVKERCTAKLAGHSRPKWVMAIDELPRTPTGKVQRFKLKARMAEELAKAAEQAA
jgi:3-hydroxybenzoate/4-hydroxybenzoate---CoA ligase